MVLVVASLFWAGGGLIARGAPTTGLQLGWWRCLIGSACYFVMTQLLPPSPESPVHTRGEALRVSVLGGIGFGGSVALWFIALKSTALVSANVISALQPLLLSLLAWRTTQRRGYRLAITAVAIAGAVVVAVGSQSVGRWSLRGDLIAVAGVVVGCLYPIGTKRARQLLSSIEYQANALLIGTILLTPVALYTGDIKAPSMVGIGWVFALVVVGGTGHVLFTWAQAYVSVSASSTILLLEVVAVAAGGAVFFDERVGIVQVVGMLIVGGAVLWWVRIDADDASDVVPELAE